jgi:hypothetical protein
LEARARFPERAAVSAPLIALFSPLPARSRTWISYGNFITPNPIGVRSMRLFCLFTLSLIAASELAFADTG